MADVTEEGSISRFDLMHTTDGGLAERIAACRLKGPGEDDALDIVQTLWSEAEHDTTSREGGTSERYVILAFRSDTQQDPEAQYGFRIQCKAPFSGASSEAPSEKGERAQSMRHSNENHNIMLRFAEAVGGRLAGELDRETKRRHELEEKIAKMSDAFEDHQDRRLDREILRAGLLQREKLMGDVVQSLVPLIPLVAAGLISKFAGAGTDKNGKHSEVAKMLTANSGVSERETLLKTFFANLDDAEGAKLLEAIKPLNRTALIEIHLLMQRGDESMKPAVDSAIQKFLKALGADEVMRAMNCLAPASRERFMQIYAAYGAIEEAQQADLPDVLKDNPPPPPPSADKLTA